MFRKNFLTVWAAFIVTVAAYAATFDFTVPPLDSSRVEVRNDLQLELTGISNSLNTKAPINSPAFTGTPTGITSTHVGLGNVDNTSDANKPVSSAQQTALNLKANLAGPTFTGVPAAPTAGAGTNTTQLATTAFATTADNLKANIASPTFTGTPAAPTAAPGTNTTQLATTAFVIANPAASDPLKANLASPTFTGVPAAPTAGAGTNTTQIATTAFATTALNLKANLASPTFTGVPAAPTAAALTNTTQLATTAFVDAARSVLVTSIATKAPLASPALTGVPTAPTATPGTNTTQLATTAFVTTAASGMPSGAVSSYAGLTEPTGWLFCYGQAVSRTTYAALFAVISTTYGVGDGSTTFNLPDMRGRVAAGQDDMGGVSADRITIPLNGDTLGAAGGAQTHVLSVTEMPGHSHTYSAASTGTSAGAQNTNDGNVANTGTTGGNTAHNITQPTMILNYIIKI